MNPHEEILALLRGERPGRVPCFSGLIHVTAEGLASAGLKLHEAHTDAVRMAQAATSTYRLTGFASAVVPLDLCVEAEALGAELDFRGNSSIPEFPRVIQPQFESVVDVAEITPTDGRIPIVCEAIQLLKAEVGEEIVIGAFMPGPFTLLSLLVKTDNLLLDLKRNPESIQSALDKMADVLVHSAQAYHQAGADMLTIHEMGGSPGFLGPKRFETIVLPPLKKLFASLPRPRILSICGNTNGTMALLAQAGADAISVDQLNDLDASRAILPGTFLFGNIDPVGVLVNGTQADVQRAVSAAISAGVDAVWPGCDLHPLTSIDNLRAMLSMTQNN
jgi:MtaA/CmuA family methyltransferase